jgi:hypothetical protein
MEQQRRAAMVSQRAYEIWLDRAWNNLPGDAETDWAEAEEELDLRHSLRAIGTREEHEAVDDVLLSDRLALCAQEGLEQLHGGPSAETARLWDAEIDA